MSDVQHLLVTASSAVIGGIAANRFGPLWGAVATGAVLLVTKHKYGVQLGLDRELTKLSTALYMLMDLALTLNELTVRELSVVGASFFMAFIYAKLPASLGRGIWLLLSAWTIVFYVSSWGFAGVVAFTSGLAYVMGAWLSKGRKL